MDFAVIEGASRRDYTFGVCRGDEAPRDREKARKEPGPPKMGRREKRPAHSGYRRVTCTAPAFPLL